MTPERRAEILAAAPTSRVVVPFEPSPELRNLDREIGRWRLSLEKDALASLVNYLPSDLRTATQVARALAVRWHRRGCTLTQMKAFLAALCYREEVLGAFQTHAERAIRYDQADRTEPEIEMLPQHLAEYDRAMGVEEATPSTTTLDPDSLADAVAVAAEGREIAEVGVPYTVEGMIPQLGVLGFVVAYTKVGKTTFDQKLGESVARGADFIERATARTRVLYVAAEDPPEYTAYVARHLAPEPGTMTFYRRSLILDDAGLAALAEVVREGGYGLVLIASWQAVIRGLVKDENDNAGAVVVVERVKATTRETGVPWMIEAHTPKAEDQGDDADPTKALRGASGAAASADFVLSLRYADGTFGSRRRLSGKGRFVNFAPVLLDYHEESGDYTSLGSTKSAANEETWQTIEKAQALTPEPRTADQIARAAGLVAPGAKVSGALRNRVRNALWKRPGVVTTTERGKTGHEKTVYSRPVDPQRRLPGVTA